MLLYISILITIIVYKLKLLLIITENTVFFHHNNNFTTNIYGRFVDDSRNYRI